MKIMIASDIHGSAYYCRQLLKVFAQEQADKLLLLGDLLYHGPRNPLPEEYNPKEVAALLNARKQQILCVRGNCDGEVDQMMLEFPILADYCILSAGARMIFATHGHRYSPTNPPALRAVDILLTGHTHVPACRKEQGFLYLNPGSVSIPKGGSCHSYMTLENGIFQWKDLQGQVYQEYRL